MGSPRHHSSSALISSLFTSGAAEQKSSTVVSTPYFASTYFPTSYFYGGSVTLAPTDPQRIPGRDGASYTALVALLEAIGSFDSVIFGNPTCHAGAGAGAHPLAVVIPNGWEEADETDPPLWIRRVLFTIRIIVRVEDDIPPFDSLDQLAAAVQVQVDRSDLDGTCLAPMTKIRSGHYHSSNQYPEWSLDLDGEFVLLVDPSLQSLAYR